MLKSYKFCQQILATRFISLKVLVIYSNLKQRHGSKKKTLSAIIPLTPKPIIFHPHSNSTVKLIEMCTRKVQLLGYRKKTSPEIFCTTYNYSPHLCVNLALIHVNFKIDFCAPIQLYIRQ